MGGPCRIGSPFAGRDRFARNSPTPPPSSNCRPPGAVPTSVEVATLVHPLPPSATPFAFLLLAAIPAAAQVPPDQAADIAAHRRPQGLQREKTTPSPPTASATTSPSYGNTTNAKRRPLRPRPLASSKARSAITKQALEQLQPLAGARDFPDHPAALYYLGLTHRALGVAELDQARAQTE